MSAEAFFSFHFFIPGWRRGQIFEVKLKCMVIRRTEQTALARKHFPLISKKWANAATWGDFFCKPEKVFVFFSTLIFLGRSLSNANRGWSWIFATIKYGNRPKWGPKNKLDTRRENFSISNDLSPQYATLLSISQLFRLFFICLFLRIPIFVLAVTFPFALFKTGEQFTQDPSLCLSSFSPSLSLHYTTLISLSRFFAHQTSFNAQRDSLITRCVCVLKVLPASSLQPPLFFSFSHGTRICSLSLFQVKYFCFDAAEKWEKVDAIIGPRCISRGIDYLFRWKVVFLQLSISSLFLCK